ncbi:MATE family efflux transporter [Xanthobacter flavus]|uniref:MATE family efflux transporter n=1 Tax=Xanthobacter flavus TaxID=281 RepID=UPI001AE4EDC8|nr:MATE family efflux transporter [Xanthobacter flavus]MBP2150511.1 Na+-driven multidrug efflux pump [Xanthobacter flavus]
MYRAPTEAAVAALSATPAHQAADARTCRLVEAPIVPLLIRLAWPNVLIMLAQASAGLIETFFVAKLGSAALAAMALVFPAVMLMTTLSAGALGGSISSAVARALGAGRQAAADALVLHAIAVSLAFGFAFAALFLLFGRQIYGAMGGSGPELEAALIYSKSSSSARR